MVKQIIIRFVIISLRLIKHVEENIFDLVIANSREFDDSILSKYHKEKQEPVKIDHEKN